MISKMEERCNVNIIFVYQSEKTHILLVTYFGLSSLSPSSRRAMKFWSTSSVGYGTWEWKNLIRSTNWHFFIPLTNDGKGLKGLNHERCGICNTFGLRDDNSLRGERPTFISMAWQKADIIGSTMLKAGNWAHQS